jgi:SAM-dependent methyltransferase
MADAPHGVAPGSELRPDLRDLYAAAYKDVPDSRWLAINAEGKASNIVRLASSVPHRRILEIGAGNGAILQRLNDRGFGEELTALEISEAGVAAIRRRELARLVDAVLYDGAHVPFPDRSFDLVILSHVVEHLEHPRLLLYQAARVADYVFVEVPLEDNDRLPADFALDPTTGHVNFYNRTTIRQLLQSSGLRVLTQSVTNQSRGVFTHSYGPIQGTIRHAARQLALRVAPPLARRVFCYHSSLLATALPPDADRGAPR